MLDIHRERGALLNSVAPLVGMGLGALGAGALAEFAPSPTRLVFDILLALVAVQTLVSFWLPETVSKQPGVLAAGEEFAGRRQTRCATRCCFATIRKARDQILVAGSASGHRGP
jgi:hypothetical protein